MARKLPLQPNFFWLLNDRQDKLHKLWTFWEILLKQIEENQKQSQINTSKHENHFDNIYYSKRKFEPRSLPFDGF